MTPQNTPISDDGESEDGGGNTLSMYEMAVRGSDYRYDYDFNLYGEDVTAVLRPLEDKYFIPIAAQLEERLDLDTEELAEDETKKDRAVNEAVDEVEDAKDDEGNVDISAMDREFVAIMHRAAKKGLVGEEMEGPDGEPLTDDEVSNMVEMLRGGYSVELGGKVLEISGSVRDATQFRGARGGQ